MDRFNRFIATNDIEVYRYWDVLSRLRIEAKSEPYLTDIRTFAGYKIRLSLVVKGTPFCSERLIPISSLDALDDETLEEYIDTLYSDMISQLFVMVIKHEA